MTDAGLGTTTAVNPFSTRCIRPGSLPFFFADNDDSTAVVARLTALGGSAQIVGPHGVGKSTLLATLLPQLAAAGHPAYRIALHDGQHRLPADWRRSAQSAGARTVVVDGFEQLSRWKRWRLQWTCRRAGWGLLVTAHHAVGLPTLAQLTPSLATLQRVVDRLQAHCADALSMELVAARFATCRGNLREALLALYDDFERLRAAQVVSSQVSDCAGYDDRAGRVCSASSDGSSATANG